MPRPRISVIIPVYNKADVLPYVLRALSGQTLKADMEYVFVDDASTDGSVAVIESQASQLRQVQIIRNTENAGPSVRINQGARLAGGDLFCLLDADELIAPNAVEVMAGLLDRERAELIHGKVIRSPLQAAEVRLESVDCNPPYSVSANPLDMVLQTRGLVRMTWLAKAAVFKAAGGCDERIFIQDEALPLRMAAKAARMVDLHVGITYAPRALYHLSVDKRQQHHDRFFAYYFSLRETSRLSAEQRDCLERTCLSVAWKAARKNELPRYRWSAFTAYVAAKLGWSLTGDCTLDQLADAFRSMSGVRRMQVPAHA